MPSVIVVGDIVTDILAIHRGPLAVGSDTDARITITGGGSGANTAAWLAWAGIGVSLVGVVGADEAGDDRLAELSSAGVDCGSVRRTDRAATGSVIVLSDVTDRTMLCDRGANLDLVTSDVDAALAAAADAVHLHLSGYPLLDDRSRTAARHALAAARAGGLTTSVDAASAEPLRRQGAPEFLRWVRDTDLLLANLDEARALLDAAEQASADDLARGLAEMTTRAVTKLGPAGAMWVGPGEFAEVGPHPAEVVDPTGAGDAFAAGLLASWLAGQSAQECLDAAAVLGARAVSVVGGRPPRPPRPLRPVRQVYPER